MAPSICCFCSHVNPPKAKFCNECASPLHLKPCRLCDAVNARDAQACYRCGAALLAAPETLEESPQHLVSEADETLAALRRELVATAATDAEAVSESIRERAGDAVANTSAAMDANAAQPTSTVQEAELDRQDAIAERVAGEEQRTRIEAGLEAMPPEPAFDASSPTVRPEERQWQPERRSRGFAVAVAIALIATPVAIYLMRNPAQLDEWLGRTAAPPTLAPTTADSAPAAPPVTVPTEAAAPATPTTSSAAAESTTDAATIANRAQQPAGGVVSLLPPSPPVEADASTSADTPTSVVVAPEREAKAAPTSRARSPAARTRSRERATKPRPQAPPAQSQREPAQPPERAARTEPCPEAVAALGLCNR